MTNAAICTRQRTIEIQSRAEIHLRALYDRIARRAAREKERLDGIAGGDLSQLIADVVMTYDEHRALMLSPDGDVDGVLQVLRRATARRWARYQAGMSESERRHRGARALRMLDRLAEEADREIETQAAAWGWPVEDLRFFFEIDDASIWDGWRGIYRGRTAEVRRQIMRKWGRLGTGGPTGARYPAFRDEGDLLRAVQWLRARRG